MEEFNICISYGKEFIEDNKNFPRCKSFTLKCSRVSLLSYADLLYILKNAHVIEDFLIYSETLPTK